jgi:hypothetical protein
MPNGDLVAGGYFGTAGGLPAAAIARWNGTSWSPLGTGITNFLGPAVVEALAVLANGDLVAGGFFNLAGGATANHIARWDGTAWSPFGDGLNDEVLGLATFANGDVAVGGSFLTAGAVPSAYFARYRTCIASYSVFGPGCSGSLGVPGNLATSLPRVGATLSVQITNLPQDAGLFTFGWSNTASALGPLPIDLGAVGAPGCSWRVSGDAVWYLQGSNQTATWSLTIPNSGAFLGAVFHTQCLVLDPLANALGAVASNAVMAVVGP